MHVGQAKNEINFEFVSSQLGISDKTLKNETKENRLITQTKETNIL